MVYIDIQSDSGIDDRIASALWSKGNAVEEFKRQVDNVKASGKSKLREIVMKL